MSTLKNIKTLVIEEIKTHHFSLLVTFIIIALNIIAFALNIQEKLYIIPERELLTFHTWYVIFTYAYFHSSFWLFLSDIIAFWWTLRMAEEILPQRKILIALVLIPPIGGVFKLILSYLLIKSRSILFMILGIKNACGLSPITLFLLTMVAMAKQKSQKRKKILFFLFIPPFVIIPYYLSPYMVIVSSLIIEIAMLFSVPLYDYFPRLINIFSIILGILCSALLGKPSVPPLEVSKIAKTQLNFITFLNILQLSKLTM